LYHQKFLLKKEKKSLLAQATQSYIICLTVTNSTPSVNNSGMIARTNAVLPATFAAVAVEYITGTNRTPTNTAINACIMFLVSVPAPAI
jgi:hypothetical protein